MSRTFYSYATSLSTIALLVMLSQSIVYLLIGSQIIGLSTARIWIFPSFGAIAVHQLVTIVYFHYHKFRFAFWASIASLVLLIFHVFSIYKFLSTFEISPAYAMTSFLVIITGIVSGLSLTRSHARKKKWLFVGGVCQILIGVVSLSLIVWAIVSLNDRVDGTIERIDQWMSLAGCVVPLFFIFNFLEERSHAKALTREGLLETVIGIGVLVLIFSTPIFGFQFVNEGLARYRNPDFVWEGARKLASPFDEGRYVSDAGDTLRYRLLLPLNYDSTLTYPVVVCLHGSSGCGNDNIRQVATCLPATWLATEENRIKYPAFLFVPQCPRYKSWGGISDGISLDSLLVEAILSLDTMWAIDKNRRYVSGNSLGGYGAWNLAGKYPEMFAAAVPICGGGDPLLAQQLMKVAIWAFHGEDDMNVPVSGSREVIEAIKKAGGNPIYTEIPDKAHDITKEVMSTPGLLDWMFSQRKDSASSDGVVLAL
jgi:dienelactone hydrolase